MPLNERTPVLVAAHAVTQREETPGAGMETLDLMHLALERAVESNGGSGLGRAIDSIRAPRGFWGYADPCRILADRLGASDCRTVVSEIGVLQTTLFGEAARDIAEGRADVVAIVGAESRYRSQRAARAGLELDETAQPEGTAPDETRVPAAEIMHPLEGEFGLGMPVGQYAVVENALRYKEGLDVETHRRALADLYARFAAVAEGNPDAWARPPVDAEEIYGSATNPMLAFPYTKLHTSQWNVDQAAALVFCSYGKARDLGISPDRFVYPRAVADNNHMITLAERADPGAVPGFEAAGRRALEASGLREGEIAHREIYSCFPAAVRIQMNVFGLTAADPLTMTGGMTFAGGPLNNFVLQATAKMWELLTSKKDGSALVTAVSGYLTKQGVSLWSREAPEREFAFLDVSDETRERSETIEVVAGATGQARVAGYTVLHDRSGERKTVALCDMVEDRVRTIASSPSTDTADLAESEELCGRTVRVDSSALELA